MNNAYQKMVDWLYSKSEVSDFQKELRLFMFLKAGNYKLSSREQEQLDRIIK